MTNSARTSPIALFGGFDLRPLIRDERADLAALLRTLSPAQWETPSLCTGWRVRDVVAHLLHDSMPTATYLGDAAKARLSLHRLNDIQVRRAAAWSTDELIDRVEASIDAGLGAAVLPRLSLVDLVIHHQDIRRPLGLDRVIPEARLRAVLDNPDPFAGATNRMRGLRLSAADIDWQVGQGPEVRGPGEAIAMSLAGRPAGLDALDGEGVRVLATRVSRSAPS
ncbi:maleylpyruvate isomerase family mycothiol-dependent enzyme [Nocardia sp. NPDC058058]|uniref:maleylpyruvate isomerase family mycothiol-dependent enzyme n=1 Tax=Nocardia sp. NPDC058058 TaxID=3346317 RepID=UPI0036DB06AA